MANAIEVSGVSKRFRLNHERHQSLKERVVRFGRSAPAEDFWALRDIDIEVAEGETVGLLGHNGSGKSTLLKCIGGILQPTTGQIRTRGRLASLLELGAGFHPDLTGRENVFLNGSILGLARRDIERRFDDIVAFAELEQFIDNQVKHYSSGMYVRLGFAVATNVDPDVLLVDEVLAVGDELFQRKCLDRVREFQRDGRTIVFVTHAADLVRQICHRAAVLDHGRMVANDTPGEAVRVFREHLLAGQPYAAGAAADGDHVASPADEVTEAAAAESGGGRERNLRVRITGLDFEHPGAGERAYALPGDPLTIRVSFESVERVDDVVVGIAVHDQRGELLFGSNSSGLGETVGPVEGRGEVAFVIESLPLLDGAYPVTVALHSTDEAVVYDWWEQHDSFHVMDPGRSPGAVWVPMKVVVRPETTIGGELNR